MLTSQPHQQGQLLRPHNQANLLTVLLIDSIKVNISALSNKKNIVY